MVQQSKGIDLDSLGEVQKRIIVRLGNFGGELRLSRVLDMQYMGAKISVINIEGLVKRNVARKRMRKTGRGYNLVLTDTGQAIYQQLT